jgi:ABC-type phosphate transport system substrate-binding protein
LGTGTLWNWPANQIGQKATLHCGYVKQTLGAIGYVDLVMLTDKRPMPISKNKLEDLLKLH